jgi:hypothetical protein
VELILIVLDIAALLFGGCAFNGLPRWEAPEKHRLPALTCAK